MARPVTGKLVVATHNPGKAREIGEMLESYGVEVVSMAELGLPVPPETGFMFSQNAAQKAHAAARAAGLPALADDSGLCVDALDGAPGLHTAEWAGEPRDYGLAMGLVRDEVARRAGTADGAAAHFTCALVVAWPDGHEELFEGRCRGHLAWPPRSEPGRGFGFDPMFVPGGHDRTFGQMSEAEKQGVDAPLSHRARAFAAFSEACLEPAAAPAP